MSRLRSPSFCISKNCIFLGLSPPPFWCGAQNWWLIMIIWDLVCSWSEPNFLTPFSVSYHVTSNFAKCLHYSTFRGPYFHITWGYSHMVGYAGSPICIAHVDMTLTQSGAFYSRYSGYIWQERLTNLYLSCMAIVSGSFWLTYSRNTTVAFLWTTAYSKYTQQQFHARHDIMEDVTSSSCNSSSLNSSSNPDHLL